MARALGPYVTSACPSTPLHPPPAETSPATRGAGGTRRGCPIDPALGTRPPPVRSRRTRSSAPRGGRSRRPLVSNVARPTLATVPFPRPPPGASAPEGGAWDSSDPRRGRRELEKGPPPPLRVPWRLWGTAPLLPTQNFITPARDSGWEKNSCSGASAASVLQSCERS